MTEVQEDIVLDKPSQETTDLQSLLEAANMSKFSLSTGIIEAKQAFEKAGSFFDLVKSSSGILNEEATNEKALVKDEDGYTENVDTSEADLENSKLLEDDIEPVNVDAVKDDLEGRNKIDNFEFSKEENGELDEEKDDLNNVELPGTDIEQKEKDVQESQTSTEFLQDDQKITEEGQFHSEQEINAYDAGYKAALDEFEKSMQMEKSSFQDIIQTMYSVGEQFQDNLEKLIKDQITELASELIGTHLQEFEVSYVNKIKVAADNILKDAADVKLELNHMDFELLKSNSNFAALAFEVTDEKDLRRGEFRLIANSSGFQQKYTD